MIRQSLAKDLPDFSGSAVDWPMFISAYEHATKICGFTNHENLIRLQKCLKGSVEVEGLLILPDSVPEILKTLRTYCGNPARLIRGQIDKAKNCPAMKEGKNESLLPLMKVVQALYDNQGHRLGTMRH